MSNMTPLYWDILTLNDKDEYRKIQQRLAPAKGRITRTKNVIKFTESLEELRRFVNKGDVNDWVRSMVCGIFWLNPETIVVNTSQLCILLGKGKSSVNVGFQEVGYITLPSSVDLNNMIINQFPPFKHNSRDIRKWSVHQIPSKHRICSAFSSLTPCTISSPENPSALPFLNTPKILPQNTSPPEEKDINLENECNEECPLIIDNIENSINCFHEMIENEEEIAEFNFFDDFSNWAY
ncbi:hypothetical protein TRFO_17758 [Tritrichomonas foetus]|uniref:Initiator binding domain-containing protein n=1 Tax=Tritrichomonas foetus TaxID=1144522 RepID=A0A1J4KMM1_9EUKA|nr:hypothetical protein TRFO_17758 [Tritrichomonas foetus]|eukprot:OHT12394.1 hypothetical protein TRFO_17758 [Tritrichomonas foetus]